MKRRDFIKNSLLIGCGLSLFPAGYYIKNKNLIPFGNKNDFTYKSISQLPKKVRLEACSLCQLNCPACFMRVYEKEILSTEGMGSLKFSDFKNFVDNHKFIKEIELSNNGEIFLNPELDKIIEYAYKKHVTLTAYNGVNLNYLPDKTAENLVKYKFKFMKVSIDGASPETYKIYRVGGDFDTVINNIKKINYYKEKYNSKYPILQWQFIPFGHNEHEIELAKVKANELNMPIVFKQNHTPSYSPIKNREKVYQQTKIKIYDGEKMFPNVEKYIEQGGYIACSLLYNEPQIDYNGNLLGCCMTTTTPFKANVFKDGLFKSLNSDDYVYTKKMLADINNVPIREDIPCTKCIIYKDLKKLKISYKNQV